MKISTLRRISKFIDKLIECGYDGDTDLTTLLANMGYTVLPDNLANILTCICELERNIQPNMNTMITMITMIETADIEQLITISDELCITKLTNLIMIRNNPLRKTMDNYIINHNDSQYAIRAYNTGYKVFRNSDIQHTSVDHIDILKNCIQNGLYIKNIHLDIYTTSKIDTMPITDIEEINVYCWHYRKNWNTQNLISSNFKTIRKVTLRTNDDTSNSAIRDIVSSLPSLETIEFGTSLSYNNNITIMPYCESTHTNTQHRIKSLSITNHALNGIICELFGNIRELYISQCNVGTKNIIPRTVKKLHIFDTNVSDAMIGMCAGIKYLYVSGNSGITTCAPFAKTITRVILCNPTAIGDKGLALCSNLRLLDAKNNPKITTCAPFALTLRELHADDKCGIGNDGLKLCSRLTTLYACGNINITTCAPFAKSLTKLDASMYCGINNNGLKLCSKLKILYMKENPTITTCEPFAGTLEILDTSAWSWNCGMSDNGLKLCSRLKYLDASGNAKITTCVPFAKTLQYLYALGNVDSDITYECGITDDGIKLCTKLTVLDSRGNNNITLKLPIIYDG